MPSVLDIVDVSFPRGQFWAADLHELQRHVLSRRPVNRGRQEAPTLAAEGAVAVIEVSGILTPEAEYYGEVSMPALAALFRAAAASDEVSAVVLSMDSPGGYAEGMLELCDAARELAAAKPLLGHVRSQCCSGCYWLASTCRQVFADRRRHVGSIGTRILIYDWSKFFAEAGVEAVAIDTGPFKSLGAMGTEVTEAHRAHLQRIVEQYQSDFAAAVQAGRGLSDEQYAQVADGRVWLSEEAAELGLIDGVQSLRETILLAAELAAATVKPRSHAMSKETETTPPAATLAELKRAMPAASAEFRESQLEKGATLADAMTAYIAVQAEENAALVQQKEEAEKRAAEAAKTKAAAPAATVRGNRPAESQEAQGAGEVEAVDYHALAREYQEKHKCRWSEACLEIKRRHPEAREAFGAPAKA